MFGQNLVKKVWSERSVFKKTIKSTSITSFYSNEILHSSYVIHFDHLRLILSHNFTALASSEATVWLITPPVPLAINPWCTGLMSRLPVCKIGVAEGQPCVSVGTGAIIKLHYILGLLGYGRNLNPDYLGQYIITIIQTIIFEF